MMLLNSYTVLVAFGVSISLAYACWQTHSWRVLTDALIIGVCAMLLGRIGYAALHFGYFVDHTYEIVSLTNPGYQEHAALCGGFIGYWLLTKRPAATANSQWLIAICLCLIGIAASLGCISNGCAYGHEVFWQTNGERSLAWLLSIDWPDAYGINNPRLPTQLFMAGWLLVVCILFIWIGKRDKGTKQQENIASPHHPITPSLYFLLLFAIGDFIIQFARADASLIWLGLRVEQWTDVVLSSLAAAGIVRTRLQD